MFVPVDSRPLRCFLLKKLKKIRNWHLAQVLKEIDSMLFKFKRAIKDEK
jgi:hypothetical protein